MSGGDIMFMAFSVFMWLIGFLNGREYETSHIRKLGQEPTNHEAQST